MNKNSTSNTYKTVAYLHFEDGTNFMGIVNRPPDDPQLLDGIWGESAFTTAMTGYQETITDPSFLGQHIIFTTAHIGTYEANPSRDDTQAKRSFATCIIARNFTYTKYLEEIDIPIFADVDTRKLVRYLTSKNSGSHKSVLTFKSTTPTPTEFKNAHLITDDLHFVSQINKVIHIAGPNPIVLLNYGVKQSIVKQLIALGFPLVSLPHNTKATEVIALNPRLVFLSNGPGNPQNFTDEIAVVRELLQHQIPIRGICLGIQLIAKALDINIIKLPFGQRGINHPVINHITNKISITSQNHGYALDVQSFNLKKNNNLLNRQLFIQHSSLFDDTIESISTTDHFMKAVQFHPEANPGPHDMHEFFDEIKVFLDTKNHGITDVNKLFPFNKLTNRLKKETPYKRILVIGSGPIKIGQAAEFDYSGTQALKALQEEGIEVVLLNSNPATIMTDPEMSTRTYIEPITKDTIKKIILKESVDAVLSTLGGQTALNLCIELETEDFLKKNNVALLGANVDTIKKTEDRSLFAKELTTLGYQTGKRFSASNESEALLMATNQVNFPLIIRHDYALGGQGAVLVHDTEELKEVLSSDIKFPIVMEKSLVGQKEVELEVMVDCEKNGVIICSIENIDPCGIHTGDSITVAPAITISDHCMQKLRIMALTIAKHLGVVAGGANVQFAIDESDEDNITVIEMNPRVSRSSALASKATGYPIAKISALLSIGYNLKEILNDITKASPVSFEPTLDYVAVKIPIFPFGKFPNSTQILGPQMRSVGEVLALGGSFTEAFLKALRSLEAGLEIPQLDQRSNRLRLEYLIKRLQTPMELSLLTVLEALRAGLKISEIGLYTKINHWFLEQMEIIFNTECEFKKIDNILEKPSEILKMKKVGFSDKYISLLSNITEEHILKLRLDHKILPVFRAVDTCSGEFIAETPYFYSTYNGLENETESVATKKKSIAILGSGPNRIGQGIEFDYLCVKSCQRLKEKNIFSIMINSNPETVSTDYDISDRLYIAPLYSEDIFDILLNEKPYGFITSFSGQTGVLLRKNLECDSHQDSFQINFLGPTWETLEQTEDRLKFSILTQATNLSHTNSKEVSGMKNLLKAIEDIHLPVIVRPSFVIGGESMFILQSPEDLNFLPKALMEQIKNEKARFQVETYIENALEYDVDLVRDQYGNFCFFICEHIEFAGVHSGDSGMFTPPILLSTENYNRLKEISVTIANKLNVVGPINFQFAIDGNDIYCIEANLRGSRTIPFLSKAFNIPIAKIATDALLGEEIECIDQPKTKHFSIKQSTFPFDRFVDDSILLGPKMRSTGETMGVDFNKYLALLKSHQANYPNLGSKGKILVSLADDSKEILVPYLKLLYETDFEFIATKGTFDCLRIHNIPCKLFNTEKSREVFKDKTLKIVFNTARNNSLINNRQDIRNLAILYKIPCFTRLENIQALSKALFETHSSEAIPVALQELY